MQNDMKGLLTLKTSQSTLPLSKANERDMQKDFMKKQQNNTDMGKENIDLNLEGQKEAGVHPEKFNGPGQKPKTANKAFGGISDFVLFFENRNPEMKEFAKKFEDIGKMDSRQSMTELNKVIVPKIDECLEQMYQKIKTSTKSKTKKCGNKYAELFKNSFKTWGEFYKQVFRAYTISGFLYKKMNKYLRNENWMELDALLPYVYCLFKAFLWGPTWLVMQESFKKLRKKLKGNRLILYRGADFDDESLEFYDPTKIKNFSWNGVISTSLEEFVTKKFQGNRSKRPILITIEIDFENLQAENLNALYLAEFSEYPKEEEVVLPPGSIFELLEINKENPEVVMRLRLVTNVEALAHKGQFMHGMLQAIMRSENELKIVCLEEKELSRAMKHCQGNKLIKNLEFCFCTFNKEAIRVFKDVIPTIENLVSLTLNIVKLEEDCRLDEILECLENTRIKELHIFAVLDERRHIEAMVESLKYLSGLEYLNLRLEEDCQMDASLFQDLIGSGCQFLNSKCIFDVDLGTRYNLITKGSNLNDFERCDIMKAMNQNWPPCWGRPPNSISKTKFISEDSHMKEHLKTTRIIEENSRNDRKTQNTMIQDDAGLKDERNENIEIIESSRGMRKFCLEGRTLQLEFLTSLHLRFKEDDISDKEMIVFCTGIRHLQSLKILDLIFDWCGGISDKEVAILSCHGIQKLSSITSLSLSFKKCKKITDEGLKTLGSEGIKHLSLLTSLHLNFKWCESITDEGLKTLGSEGIKHLPLLTSLHLNFESWWKITDRGFKTLVSEGIKHLPLLTSLHLNFNFCWNVTDEGLKTLISEEIKHLPLLTSLHLNFACCKYITEKGFKTLGSEGIKHLPLLTSLHLNFESWWKITDKGFKTLVSEAIKHLLLLTSLHLIFRFCWNITIEGLTNLYSEWIKQLPLSMTRSKIDSLPIHRYQDLQISENSMNFTGSSFQNLSYSNQNAAFAVYNAKPGFYFKECPFVCEPNIPELLQNHSPFHDKEFDGICLSKETQENYQATFHLNFTSESIDNAFSNLDGTASSWQNVKTLNLIFHDCLLLTLQGLQCYWNILQYFKSIVKLNISSNEASFLLDDGLQSLFDYGRIENLKSLKSINFVFPKVLISERTKANLLKASSSFTLNLLTSKKFEIKIVDLKMSKQKVKPFISKKTCQILKTKSQEIQVPLQTLQSNLEKTNMFLSENFGEIGLIQSKQKITFKQKNWERELALKENSCKRHFDCRKKITNSQEKFKPFPTTENAFLEEQSFPIQELNFHELTLKSLLVLDLNFFGRNDITNKILQNISVRMSDLKSLRVLNLNLYGCRRITDEGLVELSSQGLNHLRKLTELSLDFGFCNGITDKGLDCLGNEGIKHLELLIKLNLNFEWCLGLENLSCRGIGSLKRLTELHLNFNSCTGITDIGADCGLQSLKSLTILSIDFGWDIVYNLDLRSLSKGIQHLESLIDLHLNFIHCTKITDQGLEWLSHGLQNLKLLKTLSLNFDKCPDISDQSIKSLSCGGIRYLKSLTSLHLSFDGVASQILTDEALESLCCEAIQHLDNLKTLELISQGQNQITDRGIKSLAFKAMSKLISLENLQLPLMQTVTSSSSIVEAFRNILIYFGLQQESHP